MRYLIIFLFLICFKETKANEDSNIHCVTETTTGNYIVYKPDNKKCSKGDVYISSETANNVDEINNKYRKNKISYQKYYKEIENIIKKDPTFAKVKKQERIQKERKKFVQVLKSYYLGDDLKMLTEYFLPETKKELEEIIQNKKIDSYHAKCTEGWFSPNPGTKKYQDCLDNNQKEEIAENVRKIKIAQDLEKLPKEERISETCIKVFGFKKGGNNYNTCVLNSLMVDMSKQRAKDQKKIKELELQIAKIKNEQEQNRTVIVDSGAKELAKELRHQRRQSAFNNLINLSNSLLGGSSSSSARPGITSPTCFFKSSTTSGMNKICYYSCPSGQKTTNVGAVELCPLTM